jgi:hypothetical protein
MRWRVFDIALTMALQVAIASLIVVALLNPYALMLLPALIATFVVLGLFLSVLLRSSLHMDDAGVSLCNGFRTVRVGWTDVCCMRVARYYAGRYGTAQNVWLLSLVSRSGQRSDLFASAGNRQRIEGLLKQVPVLRGGSLDLPKRPVGMWRSVFGGIKG